MSKYENMLFDGRWKVIDSGRYIVTLENIYNHETMEIRWQTFLKIVNGGTTVSNVRGIRTYRAVKGKTPQIVTRHFGRKKNEHKTMENLRID